MVNSKRKINFGKLLIDNNTYIILLLLIIVSAMLSDNFLTWMNIRNIALQQAGPILVAIGMLFVILAGGIDLSVGSIIAVGAIFSSIILKDLGMYYCTSIILAFMIGVAFGMFTGIFVPYTGIQGFVASLATMTIARGLAFVLPNGTPVRVEH